MAGQPSTRTCQLGRHSDDDDAQLPQDADRQHLQGRPLLNYLMSKGRVRKVNGGYSIVEPIIYAEGEAGSYSEWQQLTITPQEGISAAQFPWRQLYATIAISGLEEAQNNGKEQVLNLLEAKVMQAEETLKNRLSQAALRHPGGARPDQGLPVARRDHRLRPAPIGGIDPAPPATGAGGRSRPARRCGRRHRPRGGHVHRLPHGVRLGQ